MLNSILAFSLRQRTIVLLVGAIVAVYGLWTASGLSIDVLPDLNRPTVTIMTEAHGMVPEDVEQLVTWPIEQVMNGATGVVRVRSQSGVGLSVVAIEFDWGTDVYRSRQIVAEKLQLARDKLPPGVQSQLAPISSIMGQIQLIGFRSTDGTTSIDKIRDIVDRDVRPRLLSLSGIAQIVAIGGQPRELQVTVDPDRLRAFDVTLPEVAEAIAKSNVSVTAGVLQLGSKGPLVAVPGRIRVEEELAQAVIGPGDSRPVTVQDVADVRFEPAALRTGEAGIDGGPGVILVIVKQPEVDTVVLTEAIDRELSSLDGEFPSDVEIIDDLFQQAAFIHRAVDNVMDAVRDGGILVIIVLFLFLLNFRTTLITLTAIPLSVAVTAIVFAAFDLGINTMTLGGLAVAIGTLVDDAIVDVENVYRRLHQNAQKDEPDPAIAVVFRACSEVRRPIIYGTILVTVVYLPLFFLSGIEGRLFAPIGVAYVISVMASLAVALTVTPALCYMLLGRVRSTQRYGGWLVDRLRKLSEKSIRFSLKYPVPILSLLVGLVLVSAFILMTRGASFLPAFNEGTAQVNLVLPPDTSLEVSSQFGGRLERLLVEVDGIDHVARRTGRSPGDEHAMPVSVTEAIVTFDPESGRSRDDIIGEIRHRLGVEFPGVANSTEQPLAHLLSHLLSGVTAQVAIKVFGPDLPILRNVAAEVEGAIASIEGVTDLYVEAQVLIDQVEVKPNRAALRRFGLTVEDVALAVELSMGAEEISRLPDGQISYPIVVRFGEESRRDLEDIRGVYLRLPDGGRLLLEDVADVRITKTPNNINRENGGRRIVIQHNVEDRPLSEVVAEVEAKLVPIRKRLSSMPGYAIRVSGQFEAQEKATRLIALLSVFSLLAMFGILFLHFRSANLALQVLLSIPMAFVGAAALIMLTGQTLSVATLVGLIALGGIAARNAILLIDHYLHLMRHEGEPFGPELIVRAGQERMIPVLMTAMTSGIGLLPLALAPDQPGRELLYPVATVIIGGLISSTILDFLVTPGIFSWWGRAAAERVTTRVTNSESDSLVDSIERN